MWSLSSFPGISALAPCFPPEALSSSQPAVVSLSSPNQPGTSSPIWRAFLPASCLPGETFPPFLSTAVTALPTASPSPSPLPQGPSWWDLQNKHPPALGDGRGDNYTLNAAKLSSAREKRPEAAGDNPFRGTLLPPTALSSASHPKPASAAISAVIAFVGPSRDGIQPRARVQSAGAGPAGREMGMQRGIWMSGDKETWFPTELGCHWASQHLSSTISEDGVLPARAAREPSLVHVFGACPGKCARISHPLPHHRF